MRPAFTAGLILLLAPGAHAALVLNQIHHSSGDDFSLLPDPMPSQVFTDAATFTSIMLEDFTVDSSQLQIISVSGLFRAQTGFSSFQDVTAYQVSIFSTLGLAAMGIGGDVANLLKVAGSGVSVSQLTDGSATYHYGRVDIAMNILLPAAGTYWIGIAPVAETARQFFLQTATPVPSGGLNARFANPGGAFGLGLLTNTNQDFAYSVSAVPEPSAWLHIAACAMLSCFFRRRARPSYGF